MKRKYVFDLDNTLFFTDNLNNEAYNFAFEQVGILPIVCQKRITREFLIREHPSLSVNIYNEILRLKQEYFVSNLERILPNKKLFDILNLLESNNCILWTSADKIRVNAILDYYNIRKLFKKIVYSDKKDINCDVKLFCQILECRFNEIIFYEDNSEIINDLLKLNLEVVIVNNS